MTEMREQLRRTAIMPEGENLNSTEVYESMRTRFDRADIRYWLIAEYAQQGSRSEQECLTAALRRMSRRELPVAADDADAALDLPPGTTLFFNHAGNVPAEAVLTELERQVSSDPPLIGRTQRESDESMFRRADERGPFRLPLS